MAQPRKVTLNTDREREKLFLELIDHLMRYNDAEKKWVAEEAGIHWGTLYAWCAGNTFSPQIRTLAAVARTLGYEIVLKRTKAAPPKLRVIKNKTKSATRKKRARKTKMKAVNKQH